jgi:hypothetical protein
MPQTLSGGDIKITENIIEKSHQKECRICYFTSSMERGVTLTRILLGETCDPHLCHVQSIYSYCNYMSQISKVIYFVIYIPELTHRDHYPSSYPHHVITLFLSTTPLSMLDVK